VAASPARHVAGPRPMGRGHVSPGPPPRRRRRASGSGV
jgi:hypothetical protein